MRTVVGYHLGLGSTPTATRPTSGGGKSVRAALALLSARAAGGADADGLPGAVAVELVHTFSLLHDDIMDGDAERHHRPAAWAVFGRARAILAGDAVLALAFRVLLDSGSPHRVAALESLADATARLIDGQAADLDLEGRLDATPEQCTRMCAGKTGALLECAASIGAVLAGAGRRGRRSRCARSAAHLGLAFQAVDDLLGIWGDPAVTGKPVFGDLVRRKTSLPVAIALQSGNRRGAPSWPSCSARPHLDAGELAAAAGLVEACGGRDGRGRAGRRRSSAGRWPPSTRRRSTPPPEPTWRRSPASSPRASSSCWRAYGPSPATQSRHDARLRIRRTTRANRRGRRRVRSGPNTSRPASRSPATSSRASTGCGLRTRRCSTLEAEAGRLVDQSRGCTARSASSSVSAWRVAIDCGQQRQLDRVDHDQRDASTLCAAPSATRKASGSNGTAMRREDDRAQCRELVHRRRRSGVGGAGRSRSFTARPRRLQRPRPLQLAARGGGSGCA